MKAIFIRPKNLINVMEVQYIYHQAYIWQELDMTRTDIMSKYYQYVFDEDLNALKHIAGALSLEHIVLYMQIFAE